MKHSQHISRQNLCAAAWLVGLLFSVSVKAQPHNNTDWRYTVRPKDTLFALTQQHLKPSISWEALARYNHLPNGHVIHTGTQLRMPLPWLAAHQAKVKLTALSGDVLIKSIEGQWHKGQISELLQTGQVIQVNGNSSASLQFADMSELIMQPNSTLQLNTLSVYAGGYMADTKLRLQAGRVEVNANPQGLKRQKFNVITPAAVASVRGTQFLVEAQAERTLEQTMGGTVALNTSQGSVVVKDGYGSAAKLGERPLPPEVIKPAPELQNPSSKFTDFPIEFTLTEQVDVHGWVMQIGRDAQMTQLVLEQQTSQSKWDAGGIADGSYHFRAWSLDAQGMPSKPVIHPFEVTIPRKLQGPAIQLPKQYFANGPMALNLVPLSNGQKYLLQVTTDPEGRLPIWHMSNAGTTVSIPAPLDQVQPCYLWVWIY